MEIPTLHEGARGCGYRKPGGLYLVSGGTMEECELLPVVLDVCPTCHAGIHPTRGFTWVGADPIIDARGDTNIATGLRMHGRPEHYWRCPLYREVGRAGLIWVGERFYPSVSAFMAEAERMGVSRRIPAVPKDFEVGKTLVFLAHRKAITTECECTVAPVTRGADEHFRGVAKDPEPDCEECGGTGRRPQAAIFTVFIPKAVEYIVKGDETDEELERMVKRGIRPVRVEPIEETLAVGAEEPG